MNPFVGKKVLFLDHFKNERQGIIIGYSPILEGWNAPCYLVVPMENYFPEIGLCDRRTIQHIFNVSEDYEYIGKRCLTLKFSSLLELWDK